MSYATLSETEWAQVNRVWDLLDEGEVEQARATVDALLRARPGHPDARIVEAAVCLDEGEPGQALETLQSAERSADPALLFYLRAVARFELVRFEQARDDALSAVTVTPDLAEAHELLARIYEYLGQPEHALKHTAEARAIDPVAFTPPLEISDQEFQAMVEESQGLVDAFFKEKLKEVPGHMQRQVSEALDTPVLVVELPWREILTADDPHLPPDLLGLFVGRSLLDRSHLDLPGVPEAIYLFRRNLLRFCTDREELAHEVRTTVQHEMGHLLGFDEADLEDLGLG
ncbi:MAG: tetratricopeptide repeat protein [Gemmatimonadales bacterium]|nr:MAG: tetratricopeptide repeat protein [Gemmatimonadales bacterium]